MNILRTISILIFVFVVCASAQSQKLSVVNLTVESKRNPLGVESSSPAMSWQLFSSGKNILQTAYRIIVADDPALLKKDSGNVWDSKKNISDQSVRIKFAGQDLAATKTYHWKVLVWDNKGNSSWSDVAQWQMGLLTKRDWKQAQWIAYEKIPDSVISILPSDGKKDIYRGNNILPLLRKSFDVNKKVKKATLFVCGLGQFEANINGKKIGDHFLDPGWTKYDQQALYVPFDVTGNLKQGSNAIGVMLGNGFYYIPPVPTRYRKLRGAFGYPKMICRLAIEYADGSSQDVISDTSWKTAAGPIVFSSIYGGEDYDANLEQKGWDQPGFNEDSWKSVVIVDGPPVLNAQMIDPVKVMDRFTSKRTIKLNDTTWVFDLGQNASGIPQIKVKGKKGQVIRIIPAELLLNDSSANQKASGRPFYFEYVLKGDGVETWQPRFTYYGFRYLQIQGAVPANDENKLSRPTLIDVEGLHIRNSAATAGTFASSNQLFNHTFDLVNWAIRSNTVSVFTDCPHREKLGWLEQVHLMGASVKYNYDVASLFKKLLVDMKYSQTEEGLVPEIAPEFVKFDWGNGMFRDSPEWGSASIIVPWYLYQWYGDKDVLSESYPLMVKYEAYLRSKLNGDLLYQGLGDWYDLGPKPPGVSQLTPKGVTASAMYYYDLNILRQVADVLGNERDALQYSDIAFAVRRAFNDSFFNANTKQYGSGSQAANAMAVYMGLVEDKYRQDVIDNIVKDIRDRNNSLTAGDIGYRYLLCVLHDAGRDDVIFDMNSRTDVPGYGYQLKQGATALTESWAALPTASNNHFMLGHIMEWFYRGLAGIEQSDSSIGYKQIVIHPNVVGDLSWVKGSHETPYGLVKSEWKKKKNKFELTVTIPANTTAYIVLPEGKKIKGEKKEEENKSSRILVGSGTYKFQVEQ